MKRILATLTLLTLIVTAAALAGRTDAPAVERALSSNPGEAAAAIAELRAEGQAGVDALAAAGARLTRKEDVASFRAALDRVCRQRDCYASHLYWYTDLIEATVAARTQNKPILSLRLLGNLDDELSCANSRFFRTTLYADPRISRVLRDKFILHWSSERPVPRVTIDFGDGRKLCSTITGNSAHYLLDATGRPLDVVPGLYAPDAFLWQLNDLLALGKESPSDDALHQYHAWKFNTALNKREAELLRVAVPLPPAKGGSNRIYASKAASLAMTKGVLEMPLLRDLGQPVQQVLDTTWKKMAASRVSRVSFDSAAIALMRDKTPSFTAKMLARLQESVAEDTLRNEYDLHLRIHQWLATSRQPLSFDTLNKRVYADLFLTPRTDPWLGLLQEDAFPAIEGGGVVGASK